MAYGTYDCDSGPDCRIPFVTVCDCGHPFGNHQSGHVSHRDPIRIHPCTASECGCEGFDTYPIEAAVMWVNA